MNADTGRMLAATLSTSDVDDASQAGPLLDQVMDPVASFTADVAYDQEGVYGAQAYGVRALTTFAAGIAQDAAAVNAALTTPWISGQAEGQITRLKLLKRQSYGRASLDLLRQRVLLAV